MYNDDWEGTAMLREEATELTSARALIACARKRHDELTALEIILELLEVLEGFTLRRHLNDKHGDKIRALLNEHNIPFSEITALDRTRRLCISGNDRRALLHALYEATMDIRIA